MTPESLLADLQAKGVHFQVVGDTLRVDAPKGVLTPELRQALYQHKVEILVYLKAKDPEIFLLGLAFPIGYGGLPQAQVEAAEIVNDKFGIEDLVHRKYNVLSWVRGYYQDRGENYGEYYEAIKQEQLRLGQMLDGEVNPE
jgi:hypothetical protein